MMTSTIKSSQLPACIRAGPLARAGAGPPVRTGPGIPQEF